MCRNVNAKRTVMMWLRAGTLFFAVFGAGPVRAESGQLAGQGNDGNRSKPVHRIEIYDDQGYRIRSFHENPQPFSTRTTCGRCHEYGEIASGWHFNGHDSEVEKGRPGQPWVLIDSRTRTQLPLSGRKWPGTFTPEELGMSAWDYLEMVSSHYPGGSYGEMDDEVGRHRISGCYEINCLACHNADPHQDQDMAALQAAMQNYRWIPAASSHMAVVDGATKYQNMFYDPAFDEEDGVTTTYKEGLFDSEDMVLFDITGKPLNERCYFCHSNKDMSVDPEKEWTQDQDVHLQSGMNCVDCHRNGDDHMITRGIETEGPGKTLTCEGCHLGDHEQVPELGRMGAPKPKHRGIPTIHFEQLNCTACHSSTWPAKEAGRWKTARIHRTGLHGPHTPYVPQPHVYAPVLMKDADGKIGPYKLFWPAYWGIESEEKIIPIPPEKVLEKAGAALKIDVEKVDDWRPLTEEQIADVLKILSSSEEQAVYIAGGKLYRLNAEGGLASKEHDVAKPVAWAIAHDVRPAEQSLGVRKCKDCHTTDSPFFFGKVEVDTPVRTEAGVEFAEMIEIQGIDRMYMWAFNFSFIFRPFLKIIAFVCCGLIGVVVLAYILKAVAAVSNACAERGE